jgi:hypothetical protein
VCCIFLVLVFLGPRAGILIWWLADQARWNLTFQNFIWPFLGFLFLPWTTLMYVVVWPMGIEGFDWAWLALAFLADVAMYAGSAYKRQEVPGYNQYVSRGGQQ